MSRCAPGSARTIGTLIFSLDVALRPVGYSPGFRRMPLHANGLPIRHGTLGLFTDVTISCLSAMQQTHVRRWPHGAQRYNINDAGDSTSARRVNAGQVASDAYVHGEGFCRPKS
jgi:hypothetical protein